MMAKPAATEGARKATGVGAGAVGSKGVYHECRLKKKKETTVFITREKVSNIS
jgi:hypothetical protein